MANSIASSILRGEVEASDIEINEAKKALSLINWKDLTYTEVLIYTEKIKCKANSPAFTKT